jgi:Uri superfamily endonuclease
MKEFVFIGEPRASGAYILRICVDGPLALRFGRFRQGEPVALPAGEYVYVGSAMGGQGSTTLARRILRHATRSGARPPHAVRLHWQRALVKAGLLPPGAHPSPKRLRWHIDYLLDEPLVELSGVLLLGAAASLESALAKLVSADPAAFIPVAGLGASDAPGATHFFGIEGNARTVDDWWADLAKRASSIAATSADQSA